MLVRGKLTFELFCRYHISPIHYIRQKAYGVLQNKNEAAGTTQVAWGNIDISEGEPLDVCTCTHSLMITDICDCYHDGPLLLPLTRIRSLRTCIPFLLHPTFPGPTQS